MRYSGVSSSALGNKDLGAFYGINRTNRINDAQMSDVKNLDCENFPYLSTRRGREVVYAEHPLSVLCRDSDITDDYKATGITKDGNFVYRGAYINFGDALVGNDYVCEHLGDYVCFPNRQIVSSFQTYSEETVYDVEDFNYKEEDAVRFVAHKGASQECSRINITNNRGVLHSLCDEHKSIVASGAIQSGRCYYPVFRSCYASAGIVTEKKTMPDGVFIKIDYVNSYEGVMRFSFYTMDGEEFNFGEWLELHQDEYSDEGWPVTYSYNGNGCVTLHLGTNVTSLGYGATELQLDYIFVPMSMGVSFGGRLFCCDVFGIDVYYSSAADRYDFLPGTSLGDAGAVSCAEHGRWTGIITYGGALYVFKRNGMYRIYSSDGLNFYLEKVADVGAISSKSICVVSDVLYFLSETGIYKFTGSYPKEISDAYGRVYTDGVFGGYDNKLYASCVYSDGRELLVYNTDINAYGVHDDFDAVNFVTYGGKLYALSSEGVVYYMSGERECVDFYLETRKFFLSFEKKAINGIKIYFDFSGGEGEKMEVFVSYDGGEWERCFRPIVSGKLKYVPIKFKKCDELCVRIEGCGTLTVKGLSLSLYSGGNIKQNR